METTDLRNQSSTKASPHSLGILIEWKQNYYYLIQNNRVLSPLAGDINWMETVNTRNPGLNLYLKSPLAGDINWMETIQNRI